ncbi:MAG: hypothetical protein K2J87_00835 [Muribaculaceae bacterium]|nr:hypothetical protein [Muribaculaceae bacterium]
MKHLFFKTCMSLSPMLLLTGCIDNSYDLSDIDKTTQVNVNDLVVPVNIDAIELSEIIKIDEESKIKIVNLDGQEVYAVTESGTIHSDPIDVKGFTAISPAIQPAHIDFVPHQIQSRAQSETLDYDFKTSTDQEVKFSTTDVDESIKEITSLDFKPMTITMHMTTAGLDNSATIMLPNLTFQFLKGLVIPDLPQNYKYNPETGILTVENLDCPNQEGVVSITAVGLNFEQAGDEASLKDRAFEFKSNIEITDAKMKLTIPTDKISTLADQIRFDINTSVQELEPTYFSGKIEYKLEGDGLSIDPVSLSDIPDFLSNDDTDLRLANPQIYLGLNNPMATYGLNAETGIELASVRAGGKTSFGLNSGELVRIGTNHGVDGPYNFVLSPSMPQKPLTFYATNLSHVGFSSLSDVLAGSGLPESIEISLVNPQLPLQTVNRFKLDSTIPPIDGTWEFFAPLALKTGANGSVIVYSKTEDGWYSEDLDKLTIKTLNIEADVDSDLPLGATLNVYPINKDGQKIPNVTVTPATISANAKGERLSMTVTGVIRDLDGVTYEAVVKPGSEEALSPQQTIRLSNIKAKVSGYYLTDFE